jgi:histidinol-phosphate phosphatase family protein
MSVQHGVTGYLVPPRDPDAIAERLAHLFHHPHVRRTLGRQALRRVSALFTWRQVGTALEGLFHEVAQAHGRKCSPRAGHRADGSSLPEEPKPAVFLDKDGTLIEDVPYNIDPQKIRLSPGAEQGLSALHEAGYPIVVVSNQSGVARGLFPESALEEVENTLRRLLAAIDVPLAGFFYCPHHPDGRVGEHAVACKCRKPAPGMLVQAAAELGIDLDRSWMIGDILDDVEAGRKAGCRTILLDNGHETQWHPGRYRLPHYVVSNLAEAARLIVAVSPVAIGGPS